MSSEDCKHFVKCFLTWLKRQVNERNFSSDVVESIEVATQCLEAAYDVPTEAEAEGAEGGAATEQFSDAATRIYPDLDLFEMFQSACLDVSPDRKERAEEVKNEGNRLMKESKFNEALLAYNKAITLDATNATFYCNRAAAFIRLSEYEKAISDCKLALVYNPQYGKAYGRMGIAYSHLCKYGDACDAYTKAIELEPNNEDYKNNLRIAQSQIDNIGQQVLNHLTDDNTQLRNIITEMLTNPQMPSCEVASRFASQFPDVLNEIRTASSILSGFLNRGAGPNDGPGSASSLIGSDPSSTDNLGDQQPPPSNDGGGGSGPANA